MPLFRHRSCEPWETEGSQSGRSSCTDACRRPVALTSQVQCILINSSLENGQRHEEEVGAKSGKVKYGQDNHRISEAVTIIIPIRGFKRRERARH